MEAFERHRNGTLGNYAASGTEIIETLGRSMRKPASPSSIPSADSVFQIAANTSVIRLRSVTNL